MTDNKILTTKELASYLKLNEKTVIKMAQSGELPGFKVGNQWRFYLSTIDEYLQDKIVIQPARGAGGVMGSQSVDIPLSRLTDRARIILDLKSEEADGVLFELAEKAHVTGIASSTERLLMQLKNREQMLSTAVGNGVAIPHPRNPSDELFHETGVIIGRSRGGVGFNAPDGRQVHLFFLICATDVIRHLNLLAKVAGLMGSAAVRRGFLEAATCEAIMRLLLEAERTQMLSSKGSA
ncbi:MAG: PTS sugar transporter subunit IIA [Deltaproteobacteria bacterium]